MSSDTDAARFGFAEGRAAGWREAKLALAAAVITHPIMQAHSITDTATLVRALSEVEQYHG